MRKRIVTLCAVIVGFAVGTNRQEIKPPVTLEVCNAQVTAPPQPCKQNSAISFAVPAKFIVDLAKKNNINLD